MLVLLVRRVVLNDFGGGGAQARSKVVVFCTLP